MCVNPVKTRKALETENTDAMDVDDEYNSSEESHFDSDEEESESEEINELHENNDISYYAARAVPNDPFYDAVSVLAYDLPQEQPMSNQGGIYHERKQLDPNTDKIMLDGGDRFCNAAENDFNTSMAVFYYCLRNGYLNWW